MLLLIDNYDSFTYNLVHYFGELGEEVKVHRNDEITSKAVLDANPSGIILSPGPSEPSQAGICIDLVCKAAGVFPVLGVCLGHQAIGEAFGGLVTRATPVHGKLSPINHDRSNIFEGLPSPFSATRYHSLIVDKKTFPDQLRVTAETPDGLVMGLAHQEFDIYGVQFHPESIASEHGHELLKNFLNIIKSK